MGLYGDDMTEAEMVSSLEAQRQRPKPSPKMSLWLRETENAIASAMGERQEPVRQKNRAAKRNYFVNKGRGIISKGRAMTKTPALEQMYQNTTPKKNPSAYKTGRGYGMPRLKGPIGKLPMVGAIPMPSDIQGTMQDVQSPLLSNRDKMLRFMMRGSGMPTASPAAAWRARGGI